MTTVQSWISLITVVKDDLEGLKVTAESILSQNSVEFEWLIVDGFSSDGSYEYAEELASHTYVRLERIPANGIYNAMNHGVQSSGSNWLWFINAGDKFLSRQILNDIREIIKQNSSASVIATSVVYQTPSEHYFSLSVPRIMNVDSDRYAIFHHQGSIMNKSIFLITGGFDESYKFAADGKLLDSMVSVSDPKIVPMVTVGFEMGGASSKNFRHSLKEIRKYRQQLLPTKILILYQFKEFFRAIVLKINRNSLGKRLLMPYLIRRERFIMYKAELSGLQITDRRNSN
jgi:glycosyltransferase involved in cell wall biosynthesis